MARPGHKAQVKVSGTSTAMTNEACTDLNTPVARQTYQITNIARHVIDPTVPVVVQKDVGAGFVTAAASEYTLSRLNGKITFLAQLNSPGTVRIASGNFLPLALVAECRSYKYAAMASWPKDSVMGDTFETRDVRTLKDVSGSLGRWQIDSAFRDMLVAGVPVCLEFYSDPANYDCKLWALLDQRQIQAAVDGLVEESVNFTSTPDADKGGIVFD